MTMGFLLDTHVLSELMRETPNPSVTAWLDSRAIHQLQTSTVSQAEILAGIAVLPAGKRREVLANGADQIFQKDFKGRCIVFGSAAAEHYALVRAQRQSAGRPITTEDAQIAAMALAANLTLVTRNTKDFEGIEGLQVINPWQPH
jgi:predicted nucleic acid-binding protein